MITEPLDAVVVNVDTFAAFYEREYSSVRNLVYALCRDWAVAEELTQEAFVKALRRWSSVAAMDHPEAWVRRVALNLATSGFRRRTAEVRALLRVGGRRAEHSAEGGEELVGFLSAVKGLPKRQAQAVVLHYVVDLSVRDVGAAMGCAEGTVKAHLSAARGRLAELLAEDER